MLLRRAHNSEIKRAKSLEGCGEFEAYRPTAQTFIAPQCVFRVLSPLKRPPPQPCLYLSPTPSLTHSANDAKHLNLTSKQLARMMTSIKTLHKPHNESASVCSHASQVRAPAPPLDDSMQVGRCIRIFLGIVCIHSA